MRQRLGVKTCVFALVACVICLRPELTGQNAPSLQEQLKAQYKLVRMGADGNGLTVVDPGTVLDIQKGGLLGVAPQITIFCPAKFQDGDLKTPNGFCAAMVKQNSRFLQVGEKVYPTKIDVNLDKDKVSFQVVECDSCNGVQQPSFFKSEVVFQFAKGALRTTSVSQVEDTIGQVLAIDSGGDSQQGNGQGAQNQDSGQSGGGGAHGQQQGPPPEPQQIEKGQTPEQVKVALGNPEKIVNLGVKQIYVYKDLKVTFLNGKVSDVQ
ncbi:MAG: hypothetical protein LAO30_02965 [Acidobacteriia bacterium]|nr:hypothetical protein [Terriglobia bacterium]